MELWLAWDVNNFFEGQSLLSSWSYDGIGWAAEQVGPGSSTNGPALATFNGALYMAWKGWNQDQGIWWSSFNGSIWTPQKPGPGASTNGPALATFNGGPLNGALYMVWKGWNQDQRIWWSSFNGSIWTPQQYVVDSAGLPMFTSDRSALAAFNGAEF